MSGPGNGPEPIGDPESEKAPVRVCPSCSAQSQTNSGTCPHCGASFIRSRKLRAKKRIKGMSTRRKIVLLGVMLGLLVGGLAAGVMAKVAHDNRVAKESKEAEEARQLVRKEVAEEAQEVREEEKAEAALERIEAKYGVEIKSELEDAITEDANSEADEGFSEYVSGTQCEPDGGTLDPSLAAQDFHCIAITDEEEGGLYEGYRYTATINYKKGEYSWHFGGE